MTSRQHPRFQRTSIQFRAQQLPRRPGPPACVATNAVRWTTCPFRSCLRFCAPRSVSSPSCSGRHARSNRWSAEPLRAVWRSGRGPRVYDVRAAGGRFGQERVPRARRLAKSSRAHTHRRAAAPLEGAARGADRGGPRASTGKWSISCGLSTISSTLCGMRLTALRRER